MIRTYCDRCHREIPDGETVYHIDYTEHDSEGVSFGDATRHLCENCFGDLQAWFHGREGEGGDA